MAITLGQIADLRWDSDDDIRVATDAIRDLGLDALADHVAFFFTAKYGKDVIRKSWATDFRDPIQALRRQEECNRKREDGDWCVEGWESETLPALDELKQLAKSLTGDESD